MKNRRNLGKLKLKPHLRHLGRRLRLAAQHPYKMRVNV
jgi:hypothetical protein